MISTSNANGGTTTSSTITNNIMTTTNCNIASTANHRVRRSLFTKLLLGVLVFLVIGVQQSSGQLLQWNTFGNLGTETTEPSVFNDPNLSGVTNLTMGTITAAANANRFGGSNWFNTGNTPAGNTLAEAIAGNDYIQFIVTPNAGFSFTPTSFVFTWDRSSTGPSNVTLRSSADAFATDLGTVTGMISGGLATTTTRTITISGLTNLSSATTFRLYGYGATATGGTGGFDNATSVVDVQLNGTTTCIPPATPGTPTSNSPQCANVGVTLTANGSAPGGETWYWQGTNPTGTSTANPATSTYNAPSTGTYYIRSRNNTTLCWSAAASVAVIVNPTPSITLGPNPEICDDATSASITCGGITGNPNQISIDYDAAAEAAGFFDVNNAPFSGSPILLSVPLGAGPGTYAETIVVRNSGTGCISAAYPATITINPLPTMTFGTISAICSGTIVANLPFSASTGSPDQYSIDYSPAAEAQGFFDVTNQPFAGSPIGLAVPAGAAAGNYAETIVVRNSTTGCVSVAYPFTITILALPTCPADFSVCINAAPFALTGGSPAGGTYSGTGVSGGIFDPSSGAGPHLITYTTPCGFCQFTITVITNTWTGANSAFWNDPLNWTCGIPTPVTDVVIPAGPPPPVITGPPAQAHSITIQPGAMIMNNGELDIYSGLTMHGPSPIQSAPGSSLHIRGGGTRFITGDPGPIPPNSFFDVFIELDPSGVLGFSPTNTKVTIMHNLTVSNGTANLQTIETEMLQLDISGGTINLGPKTTLNGGMNHTGGTFNPGTGEVEVKGGGSHTISGSFPTETFHDLTFDGGTSNFGGSITKVEANVVKVKDGTVNVPFDTEMLQLNLEGGTTNAGSKITIHGGWNHTGGIFNEATSELILDGPGAHTVTGSFATETFHDLTINAAGGTSNFGGAITKVTAVHIKVNDGTVNEPFETEMLQLDLNGGTYNAGSSTKLTGNWNKNSGAFNAGTGTVEMSGGASPQSLGGTSPTTFYKLKTNNTNGGVVTNNNVNVTNEFCILGGTFVNNNILTNTGTKCNGGIYKGSGTYIGSVFTNNGGTIAPGQSPGCTVFGSGLDNTGGTIAIEITGTTVCTQYDQVQVTGTAILGGGTLTVTIPGFTPSCGESYTILTATTAVTGTFGTINYPTLPAGRSWNITYNANSVVLSITGNSDAPVVSSPLCPGVTSVSGTSTESNGSTITVYVNGSSAGTTTVSGGIWTKTGVTLAAGDLVKATATEAGECESVYSNVVTVKTNVSITSATAGASPICLSATTTLTANGVAGDGASVTWWTGPGGTGTQVGSGLTSNPVGPGTYYAYVTGDCGSPAEASVTVTAKINVSITSATAGASPICLSATTTLTANGVAGTGATVTWWTGSGGTGTQAGSGLTSNPVGPGTYYAYVTGDCGSPVEASVTVAAKATTVLNSSPLATQTVCLYNTATTLVPVASGYNLTYLWYSNIINSNSGGVSTGITTSTFTPPTSSVGTLYYYAVITGDCGTVTTATSEVIVNNCVTPLSCGSPLTFNSEPVVLSPTQAPNTWYTDRYPPFGFAQSPDLSGTLRVDINAADGEGSRPSGYNTSFYNTQGRKYDLQNGTAQMSIKMYVPSSWATTGRRMAGFWGTALDGSNAVSAYPIIEFSSNAEGTGVPRFRVWESGTGVWVDLGLPAGFAYDAWTNLRIRLRSDGEFIFNVGSNLSYTTTTSSGDGSVKLANVILQGHNNNPGVTYDIHWDDLASTTVSLVTNNITSGCGTGDLTAASVTAGSVFPGGTTLGYYTDPAATIPVGTPTAVPNGTYYIKATGGGCQDIKAVTVSVTPATVHNTTQSVNYCSIQSAINAANANDVITVDAGTYNETLTLNKSITLRGAYFGVNGCGRSGTGETVITAPGTTILTLVTGSAGAVIDGFTFSGSSRSIESTSGPINNVVIRNNRMVGFTGSGIFLNDNGTDITVDGNLVDGTSKVGGGDLVHLDTDGFNGFYLTNNCIKNGATANGFFVDGNHNVGPSGVRTPLISGNTISFNNVGMNLGKRAFGSFTLSNAGTISNNTFNNNTFDGVQGGMQHVLINQNTFNNNGRTGLALTSFSDLATDKGAQFTTVQNNFFFNNAVEDLKFSSAQAPGTISTNSAHLNSLLSTTAITYLSPGAEAINVTCNWYGITTPAGVAAKINNPSGSLIKAPWLTSGVDTDPGTPGFQTTETCTSCSLVVSASSTPTGCPGTTTGTATATVVSGGTGPYTYSWSPGGQTTNPAINLGAGTYTVTVTDVNGCSATASTTVGTGTNVGPVHNITQSLNYCTIQAAINAANANDVIVADAGTYNESLNVNKTLTLKGAQADVCAPTRSGAESIINCVNGIGINASGVTLNGFTIQGQTGGAGDAPGFGYAVYMAPPNTGTKLLNNIIKNNVVGSSLSNAGASPAQVLINCNLFATNNNPGAASGAGIYTDEYVGGGIISNVMISNNKFSGNADAGIDISTSQQALATTGVTINANEFTGNARAMFLYNTNNSFFTNNEVSGSTLTGSGEIRVYGGVNNLYIANNKFAAGAPHAVRITFDGGIMSSGITVFHNSLTGYSSSNVAVEVTGGYTGTLTATCNWWGTAILANIASQISGPVSYVPFLPNGIDDSPAIGFQTSAPCHATVEANPALGSIYMTNLSNVVVNPNQVPFHAIRRIHIPVLNLTVTPAEIIPSGTTKLRVDLGTKFQVDPAFILSGAPLNTYFSWSSTIEAGHVVIYGDQIADIPGDFVDETYFDVQGIGASGGNSVIQAQFLVTNHNNPLFTLVDIDPGNNNGSLTYTELNQLIVSLVSQQNVTCYGNNTGSITVQATGGLAPYQYRINAGAWLPVGGTNSPHTFGSLIAGTYTIEATDPTTTVSNTLTVTITQPLNPDVSLGSIFDTNLFPANGDEANVVYNISELLGRAATPAKLRIYKPAGYDIIFNSAQTSITIGANTYSLDNGNWTLTATGPGNLYYEFSRTGAANTIPCNTLLRISFKVKRSTANISVFNLNAQFRTATGELILSNNNNSIIMSGE